jgi:hypothetical protein
VSKHNFEWEFLLAENHGMYTREHRDPVLAEGTQRKGSEKRSNLLGLHFLMVVNKQLRKALQRRELTLQIKVLFCGDGNNAEKSLINLLTGKIVVQLF